MRITLPDMPKTVRVPAAMSPLKQQESVSQPTGQPATDAGQPGTTPTASGARPLMRPVMGPKTIKLKKPVPLGIKRDTPDPDAPAGTKRATSKISLPSDPETAGEAAPLTPQPPIRIMQTAPTAAATDATVGGEGDTGNTAAASIPDAPPQPPPDPKRQTSRISLESALGSESDNGPKTIKLKRPGINNTSIRIQGLESRDTAAAPPPPPPPAAAAGLPTASPGDNAIPETQKKTIKVKRPAGRTALRTGGSSTGSGSSSPAMFTPPTKAVAADSAHWFFILTGCAATIITGVLIYVLCAQALGPNISLTELSYGAPEAELPWPGRITR
jgi:hypothetical protein